MEILANMAITSTLGDKSTFIIYEGAWGDGRPSAVFIAPAMAFESIKLGDTHHQTYFADNPIEAMDVLAREMSASVTVILPELECGKCAQGIPHTEHDCELCSVCMA